MRRFLPPLLLTLVLVLISCAPAPAGPTPPPAGQSGVHPAPASMESASASAAEAQVPADLIRSDQQGAVTVEVTPLNLGDPSGDLEFEVALNTHSIDLGMDLAALATLTTDTGLAVQATLWDAPRGGHHVSGKLVFPAMNLEGASKITLTIVDLDAPSRVFEWQLK
jgi:hypothetical protein